MIKDVALQGRVLCIEIVGLFIICLFVFRKESVYQLKLRNVKILFCKVFLLKETEQK